MVTIGRLSSTVNVVEGTNMLTNEMIERIIQEVLARLKAQLRAEEEARQESEIRDRRSEADSF